MKKNDVLVVAIVAFSLAALTYYYFFYQKQSEPQLRVSDVGPRELSVEDSIEERFRLEIPEDIEKTELHNRSNESVKGIATREFEEGKFFLTILANIPEGDYHAALIRGNEGEEIFDIMPIGKLRVAKGGYLIEFQSNTDLSEYNHVVVSEDPITTTIPSELVFDGSF